jgi:N-methylhydantoinase A
VPQLISRSAADTAKAVVELDGLQSLYVGIDVGGTFTDAVLVTETGQTSRAKALTTPGDHVNGVMSSLARLAETVGLNSAAMLGQAGHITVGTTVVTNAIAEMRGRRTGLLVTKGFRDTMRIARCPRVPTVDPFLQAPMPEIVPRARIAEIDERLDASGSVVIALDEQGLIDRARALIEDERVEALAVCFLWSFLNPAHEQRARALLETEFPEMFLSISSELYPVIGEYERMVTTCLNAFVSEAVSSYVEQLGEGLADAGFAGNLHLGQSLGGVLDTAEAGRRPLHLYNSGPVGGVVGARRLAESIGIEDFLTADMGGTSFDVSLVRSGRAEVAHRTVMERFETGLSQLDITAIGAGGGSVCWIDERGAPRVGPHSAGADPGPACYGRGGTEPTVTDIAAVLGLLDPDYFLGGAMSLDLKAARDAIEDNLSVLGSTAEEIAPKLYRIIVRNMRDATRRASIQRGHDPRALTMLAYGGASGLFAAEICRAAGLQRVVVPNYAAVFSANGLLSGDAIRTEARTVQWFPAAAALDTVNDAYREMATEARQNMSGRGFRADEIGCTYEADMRFAGQSFDVTVELPERPITDDDREPLLDAFRNRYADLYGAGSVWEEFPVVLMTARVIARSARPKPAMATIDSSALTVTNARRARRQSFVPDLERFEDVDCYEASALPVGEIVSGPCIVEDVDTTVFVPSDAALERDEYGNLEVRL